MGKKNIDARNMRKFRKRIKDEHCENQIAAHILNRDLAVYHAMSIIFDVQCPYRESED